MDNDKVTIGFLHGSDVKAQFMTSVVSLLMHDNRRHVSNVLSRRSSVNINVARNEMVRDFIKQSDDGWLLMLDSDMVVPKTLVDAFLSSIYTYEETPIISGLMFSATDNFILQPHIYQLAPEDSEHILMSSKDYPKNSLVRVGAVGAGCLLVHRYAFAAIYQDSEDKMMPWFHESVYKNTHVGEDFTFSLKANKLGIPLHVNTGIKIGHVKDVVLNARLYDRQLRLEATYE